MQGKNIVYKRQGTRGTLTLRGVLDIFEAQALATAAKRAGADARAETLCVDLTDVERFDTATLQILLALKSAAQAQNRTFEMAGVSPERETALAQAGISF